jgi:splicing factor 3B subunit 4
MQIARDTETGNFKGYGFVTYDNFDSSDAAIDAMNGQYLMNKEVNVSYAFKKDGKGERHGSQAERLLAAQAKKNAVAAAPIFGGPPGMGRPPMGMPGARPPPPMNGLPAAVPYNSVPTTQGYRPPPPPPMGGK